MVETAMNPGEKEEGKPPYWWALGAAAVVGLLYVITLAPTTAFWDTSEYIATAHILGIPHPPGNPLFVVLVRAWDILLAPLGLSVAVKVNLFSTTMSALALDLAVLHAERRLSLAASLLCVSWLGGLALMRAGMWIGGTL